jgi:hypothetical protein
MSTIASDPDDSAAIQRTLDDGAPNPARSARGAPWKTLDLDEELPREVRAAQRRAARRIFRLYCVACGRSTDVSTAPSRPGRCVHCGGTMLVEPTVD